jgi:hypothetical protein
MRTRKLTPEEHATLDAAWDNYLDACTPVGLKYASSVTEPTTAADVARERRAWARFQAETRLHGFVDFAGVGWRKVLDTESADPRLGLGVR